MKESRKAKARELRNRLEEMNALKADEEFIIDCIDGEDVANIIIDRGEDNNDENGVRIMLRTLDPVETEDDWNEVIYRTLESLRAARKLKSEVYDVIRRFDSYETTKEIMIVRPLHIDNELLSRYERSPFMYKQFSDIALVVYVIVSDRDEVLSTVKVPMELIEKWGKETGLSKDDIFNQAMRNTEERCKPALYTNIFDIENTPFKNCMLMDSGYSVTELSDNTTTLLTTDRKTNGAIAMWYSGVKEKISELYGGSSFYVAFTSIHEAMIHKVGTTSAESIRRNVTETNRIFGPQDTLSDKVWYYDAEEKTFTEAG